LTVTVALEYNMKWYTGTSSRIATSDPIVQEVGVAQDMTDKICKMVLAK
jgi:hypothetical protein